MFLKHPAWIWLKKHDKAKLPETSEDLQAIFDAGNLFEDYAEKLFPNGMTLGFNDYKEYVKLPETTKQALSAGTKTIFQGRFEVDNITCIVDVLDRVEGNTFDLYEVKSSTKVKTEHEHDLAFQVTVLERSGLTIRKISVIHVNNEYERKGDIDIEKLSSITDITEEVRARMDETSFGIDKALKVIREKSIPDISPRNVAFGGFQEWKEIYKELVPKLDTYSIYNLYSPGSKRIGELEDLGVKVIKDIPDDFKLTVRQQYQVEATKRNERIINQTEVKNFLADLTFPLYFLDYETFSGVIPAFDGVRPYQQVPFQYSLHIVKGPGAEVEHRGYLHIENTYPGEPLIKKLQEDIGEKGSIVVWHESFEKGCNDSLGEMFPVYRDFFTDVNERIVDLMIPFSSGWFIDKDFFGSASLKNVLPVLVPSLSYKEINIHGGNAAQRIWTKTVLNGKNSDVKEKIMNDLIEYCKLDTLAMVEIWKELKNLPNQT